MTNAELIKALRCEVDCDDCAYGKDNICDEWGMRCDAADALEAAEARIAELEAQMPKEGEWIMDGKYNRHCSRCNEDVVWSFNYCPNCGAKMKGANDGES